MSETTEPSPADPRASGPRPGGTGPAAAGQTTAGTLADAGDAPAAATTPKERRRAFLILFLSLTCIGMGQTMMFAILPPVARKLEMPEIAMGAIFFTSAIIWVGMSPVWARRSDFWGRRPVILIGLAGFGISTTLFATVLGVGLMGLLPLLVIYPAMVLTRSIYGLLGPGAHVASQAYIADRTSRAERTRALSAQAAAFGIGTTLGPGVVAALSVFGVLVPLYFVAALAFVSAFAIWRFLPERTAPQVRQEQKNMRLRDPRVLPFVVFNVILGTCQAIPIQTVGFFFIDVVGFGPAEATQYIGIGLLASSFATLFAQLVLVQQFRLSAGMLMRAGCAVALAGNVFFVATDQYGALVFALVLAGLGFGMARPGVTAAASLAVTRDEQGQISGISGAAGASGFIFGPLVGFLLYMWDPHAPYWLIVALMVFLIGWTFTHPRIRQVTRDEETVRLEP